MTISASKAMLRRSAALVMAAGVLTLGVSSAAYATKGPGDNGTVKIHETGTPVPDRNNEPHVCGFYIDAFGFDKLQSVSWKIAPQAPTKTGDTKTGAITLVSGAGKTDAISLPDGHYKLTWTFAGEHGSAKHKTFWVECKTPPSTPPSKPGHPGKPSCSPSASPSSPGSPSPSTSTPPSPSTSPVVNPSTTDSSTGGSLPVTGSSLPILIGGAVAMIAAGLALVFVLGRRFRRS